ncbi:Magnesium transporter MRS2-11 [Arachis hypogaea]|nr:Magnesium transporter MRS2-11 [Arachis hypogaea]
MMILEHSYFMSLVCGPKHSVFQYYHRIPLQHFWPKQVRNVQLPVHSSTYDDGALLSSTGDGAVLSTSPNIATATTHRHFLSFPNGDNSAQLRCTPPRTVTARSSIARNPSPFSSPCSSSVPPFPGLHPRDIRSVDPSLFSTNLVPSLLVYEHMILLNLGSLQAIAMKDCVLIFEYNRKGGQAFLESLLPRLNPKNCNGGPSMPFELEAPICGDTVNKRL